MAGDSECGQALQSVNFNRSLNARMHTSGCHSSWLNSQSVTWTGMPFAMHSWKAAKIVFGTLTRKKQNCICNVLCNSIRNNFTKNNSCLRLTCRYCDWRKMWPTNKTLYYICVVIVTVPTQNRTYDVAVSYQPSNHFFSNELNVQDLVRPLFVWTTPPSLRLLKQTMYL